MLINRVANTDHSWHKEWTAPRVSPHFDLTLDDKSVLRAIDQLNFIQMKRKYTILDRSFILRWLRKCQGTTS